MGRHTAKLFPNAQRAQHYGTPPPEAESTGRVTSVATAVTPVLIEQRDPDSREGPEWSDAPTDLRAVRGELPIDPSSVRRGWRGWRRRAAPADSGVPGPLETEDHTR